MREVRVLFNSQELKMYIFDRSHLLACTKSKGVSKKESNGIFLHNPRGARIFSQGRK